MRMDVSEARNTFRRLTEKYFQGATVEFAKQSFSVKKEKPLVLLTFGSIKRPINPPTTVIDGRPASFYPTTMTVQVDLFTKGRMRRIAKGITPAMENTAEEDLLGFVNFLNSEYTIQFCHTNDIAIVVPNNVLDLTDLINDTNYEYRAMVEVELRFTTVALGYTGSLSLESVKKNPSGSAGEDVPFDWSKDELDEATTVEPVFEESPSGGGNLDSESDEEGYFTNVSINNKLVKEDKNNEF